jgi:Xaa-Pro aminopeptidase
MQLGRYPRHVPPPRTRPDTFAARRRALAAAVPDLAVVFAAGRPTARNYPANPFPFRAGSHFLYFGGPPIEGAAILVDGERATLFCDPPDPDDALWHGPRPSLEERAEASGADAALPLEELARALAGARGRVATLPPQDAATAAWLGRLLGRPIEPGSGATLVEGSDDARLADAVIALRLVHDPAAIDQLRAAAAATVDAHRAGMRATRGAEVEREVAAAMMASLRTRGMQDAYGPIVTVRGEVLHSHDHDGAIAPGDLLLCDVGGETAEGWAADVTRTWPTSGVFSATQRAMVEVVIEAQRRAIDRVRPGVRYREVHETAKRGIVEGLVELRVLRGDVDGLLERGAAALFFPHGVGHLLGLDVHDMEDLGDRAGYAPGRKRSARFGDRFLRLDRDLAPGMAVTIEPGFYQVPGILSDPAHVERFGADLDRNVLARFADVRGIRIEDDVLCTEGAPEVLTGALEKATADVERVMAGG